MFSLFIPVTAMEDRLVWCKSKNDRYLVAEGYKVLASEEARGGNGVCVFPWKSFWKIKLHRRLLMFVWRLLNSSLPYGDILRIHHVPSQSLC